MPSLMSMTSWSARPITFVIQVAQSIQKLFCRDQIGGAEPLGKAVVDRLEAGEGVSLATLIAQQAGEDSCRAQSPAQHLLPARSIERLSEDALRCFGSCSRALRQQHFTPEPQQLGRDPACLGPIEPCFDHREPLCRPPGTDEGFRQPADETGS